MTSFIADPADFLGETVTVRHSLADDRGIKVCDDQLHPGCAALVWADGPLAGRDVDSDHQPRHAYITPGFPYLVYVQGIRVEAAR
jgi:hypothetical protein